MKRSLVSVVDDDESVRESLPDLLNELGFDSRTFSSAQEFLNSDSLGQTTCLILDVAMPGMSGPDLQRELMRRHRAIPVVFITARRDEIILAAIARAGRGGVPVQTIQRHSFTPRAEHRPSSDLNNSQAAGSGVRVPDRLASIPSSNWVFSRVVA